MASQQGRLPLHPYIIKKITPRLFSARAHSKWPIPRAGRFCNSFFLYPCHSSSGNNMRSLYCREFHSENHLICKSRPWPVMRFNSLLIGGEISSTIHSHDENCSSQRSLWHGAFNFESIFEMLHLGGSTFLSNLKYTCIIRYGRWE